MPNVALIPYLKDIFDEVHYVGSKNGIEKEILKDYNVIYHSVTCEKFNRKINLSLLKIPYKLTKGINEAVKIINEVKPDIVFSKGGYVALPLSFAARHKKIPLITHESDLTPGLANKIIAKYATIVLTAFQDTTRYFKNAECVGIPLKREIYNIDKASALKYFDILNNKPTLLITGGSQGARSLNKVVFDAADVLVKTFNVIHVCGKSNLPTVKMPVGYMAIEFCNEMQYALNAADVIVSRAGANTLFEILSLNKPCLLIPLPQGQSRGDQILNAEYFFRRGMVNLLKQENLTVKSLVNAILMTYYGRNTLKNNIKIYPTIDGAKKTVDIINALLKEKHV